MPCRQFGTALQVGEASDVGGNDFLRLARVQGRELLRLESLREFGLQDGIGPGRAAA